MREKLGLRHIEAFRAVVLSGSMTEAAHQLHTSQPQISRLVSQLERITRFAVFSRRGSRLSLTLDGSQFFEEVEKTYAGLGRLESVAASIHSFRSGQLSVAAMPRLAGGVLARAVAKFKREHPQVTVSIQSGNAAAVHQWVRTGACHVGLAMLSTGLDEVQVEPVRQMHCMAVLPRQHRLAQATSRALTPQDFEGEAFISFPRDSHLRAQIDAVFSRAHVTRHLVAEANLGASVCALVGEGLGVSIVNPLAAHEEKSRGIAVRDFEPHLAESIALLYPAVRTEARLVDVFAEHARVAIEAEFRPV